MMVEDVRSAKKRVKSSQVRETARHAAKSRRDKENDLFAELEAEVIKINAPNFVHVDRITLVRLAVTLIRLRRCVPTLMKTALKDTEKKAIWSEDQITNCLDGFIIICDRSGTLLYITECVSQYLGLNQTDMVGQTLRNFVNYDDYGNFQEALNDRGAISEGRTIVMHMTSVVGPRGRKRSSKSPIMKPITFCLRILDDKKTEQRICLLLATATPICSGGLYSEVTSHFSPSSTFVTRHTCDMKFSYADESLSNILKLEPEMLIGTSFYNLVHPEDLLVLVKSLKELFKKMQCTTPYYRLMGGSDIVVWVQTEAGVVSRNSRGQHGKFVFCIHQILGSQNGAQPNSISMDAEELSVAPVTSYTMVKDLNVDSPMAFAVDSPMAYEEVLQWLISDLPESPLPDPDATPALAANAYSSKQQRELLECTNATSIVSPPEADAVELPSVNFGMENGQLQDCKGNDVSNIQFEHLAISSSSQHLLDDGSCHENNANLYPQFSTVLPTAESLSYDDTTECLETLAPFVAQEEILPLDMQGLLADLNMDAWFQSELEMYKVENNRPLETPPPPANSNRIKNSTFEIINM